VSAIALVRAGDVHWVYQVVSKESGLQAGMFVDCADEHCMRDVRGFSDIILQAIYHIVSVPDDFQM
jgi:hypothetical protein